MVLAGVALGRIAVALAGTGGLRRWAIVALAGLPPFGLFAGDFRIVGAAATVSPLLAGGLVALIGAGAARGLTLPGGSGAGEVAGRKPAVLLLLLLTVLLGRRRSRGCDERRRDRRAARGCAGRAVRRGGAASADRGGLAAVGPAGGPG
uniref:hypothetical protein n=1 Tax=Acidocella sp. C78 TaxID=1671486 RepID=UPI0020BEB7C6|nr:hypothetical protein [Acidocella sp. C78]